MIDPEQAQIRHEFLVQLVPPALAHTVRQLSDASMIDPNYALLMLLEHTVFVLNKRTPLEFEPYMQALLKATKEMDQSDPDFLEKREELWETLVLISNQPAH